MRGLVSVGLVAALLMSGAAAAQVKAGRKAGFEQLLVFGAAFERIREDAVERVSARKLVAAAIAGMLSGVDQRAGYIDPATLRASRRSPAAGDEAGIGVAVTFDNGQLRVISPRDGSPAAAAGVEPGDLILAIDKEPTYELTLAEAEQKLRGPAGSAVALAVQRGAANPLKLTLKRAAGRRRTVTAQLEDGNIGYLRLAGFDEGTPAALAAALADLRHQTGGKLAGLVLDLRNNPGGDFADAVAAADAFLDKGDIALVKSRNPERLKHIAATPGDLARGLPIVVLVNGGTAEEAELVAGALQDNRRAVLLGTKTFGESAIETVIPLAAGGAIRLTTARFTTPDGREIDGKGLQPDLTVTPLKLEKLTQEEGRHEADLPGALKNPDQPAAAGANPTPTAKPIPGANPAPAGAPPGATATPPPNTAPSVATGDIGGAGDEQLTQALDVLRGLAVFNRRASG
jgi:carboxyl-terminal processing protease